MPLSLSTFSYCVTAPPLTSDAPAISIVLPLVTGALLGKRKKATNPLVAFFVVRQFLYQLH